MTCNEAFFTLLLAGRLVAAAFVTIPHPNERSADDGLDGELETVVAKVRLAVEDSTLSFTHDPLPSYTYDPQQSHTYGPQPTYTRDSPAKRAEADDVPVGLEEMSSLNNMTLSHPPPNPTATPSSFKTTPFTSVKITSLLDPSAPVSSPTAAKTFRSEMTALSGTPATSLLGSGSLASLSTTTRPSALMMAPLQSATTTVTIKPGSSLPYTTEPPTQSDVPIAAAYMTTIDPQNGLPKLVPINAGRSSASTIDIFLTTSSVSNGLGVGSLTPTVVSGGTAYVLESFTGTELNSAYATSAPTTAFQFVSPSRLFTYSAPSTEIAWSLTGKGGTEGGWSIYTTTLPTGMAQGPLTTQKPGVTQSLLEFFSVDWGSRIPSVVSAPSTTVEASSSETANTSSETTEQTASSSVRSTQVRHTKGATVTMGSLTGSSTPSTSQPSSTCHSSSNSSEEGETGSSTSSDSGGEVSSATGSGTSSETSNVTGSASSTSSQATRAPISSTKTTSAKTSTTSERESSNLPANFIAKTTDGSDVPKSAASRSWVRISASSTALAAVLICLTLVLNPL